MDVFTLEPESKRLPTTWRESLSRTVRSCLLADAVRDELGLSDDFEPSVVSITPSLTMTVDGGKIRTFSRAVREASQLIGRGPDRVRQHFFESGAHLSASWESVRGVHVAVWIRGSYNVDFADEIAKLEALGSL